MDHLQLLDFDSGPCLMKLFKLRVYAIQIFRFLNLELTRVLYNHHAVRVTVEFAFCFLFLEPCQVGFVPGFRRLRLLLFKFGHGLKVIRCP